MCLFPQHNLDNGQDDARHNLDIQGLPSKSQLGAPRHRHRDLGSIHRIIKPLDKLSRCGVVLELSGPRADDKTISIKLRLILMANFSTLSGTFRHQHLISLNHRNPLVQI